MDGNESYDELEVAAEAPLQGRFLLSGYRSPLYDRVAKWFGWHRREFKITNCASGKNTKPQMTECLWMNYEPPENTP